MTERGAFVFDENVVVSAGWNWDLIDVDCFGDLCFNVNHYRSTERDVDQCTVLNCAAFISPLFELIGAILEIRRMN